MSERRTSAAYAVFDEGEVRDVRGVAVPGRVGVAQPADDHVRVADGLDLLEAVGVGEPIAQREDVVQQGDDLVGLEARRELGEPGHVGEQDGHVVEAVRDRDLAGAEPLGDRGGQDAQEQALVLAGEPLDLAGGGDVGAVDVDRVELVDRDPAAAGVRAPGHDEVAVEHRDGVVLVLVHRVREIRARLQELAFLEDPFWPDRKSVV